MSEPKIFIEQIGGNCPVQAEGTIDGAVFYFRSRGESWSLQVATDATGPWGDTAWAYTEDYPGEKYDAGWITEDQARAFINKGAAIYRDVRAKSDTMRASAPALYEALDEVMSWISNWSPSFTDDDEWPETRNRAVAALAQARGDRP